MISFDFLNFHYNPYRDRSSRARPWRHDASLAVVVIYVTSCVCPRTRPRPAAERGSWRYARAFVYLTHIIIIIRLRSTRVDVSRCKTLKTVLASGRDGRPRPSPFPYSPDWRFTYTRPRAIEDHSDRDALLPPRRRSGTLRYANVRVPKKRDVTKERTVPPRDKRLWRESHTSNTGHSAGHEKNGSLSRTAYEYTSHKW